MEDCYVSSIDNQRRQLILQRLEEERQLRRQHIREGTIEQFHLEDITDSNNYSQYYDENNYNRQWNEEQQMSEMKDPSQILLMEPDDEYDNYPQPEMIYQMQQDYYEQEQPLQMYSHPSQMQYYQQPIENFGYNPENLYDPNTMQSLVHSDKNKENQRSYDNVNNNKNRKHKKSKLHERLAKHKFVVDPETSNKQKPKTAKSRVDPKRPVRYMNPTLTREINQADKNKVRNEAKMIIKEVEDRTMQE